MKDTLTAPLSELAHVKTDDLRHVVRPVSRSPVKRIASMGLGLLGGIAVVTIVWRRMRR